MLYTLKKKSFNGGYLVEINITLGIDLINGGFFNLVKFQRFILKP